MSSFISRDLVEYLTRPLTGQEKKWILDDKHAWVYHENKAKEYARDETISGKLKFLHHTQEAERYKARMPNGILLAAAGLTKNDLPKLPQPDLTKPAFIMNKGAADLIREFKCPDCTQDIDKTKFVTDIQRKEYGISGKCADCQLKAFPS